MEPRHRNFQGCRVSKRPKISCLAPWFGSNRMLAHAVGEELAGCKWIGVAFAGGMSELVEINAGAIVVNDLHRHIINLARVVADPILGTILYRKMRRVQFHPDVLALAQEYCRAIDKLEPHPGNADSCLLDAQQYFIASWMNRSAIAGTDGEFKGGLPVRWSATGGDSAVRFHSAARSIVEWRRICARCNFTVLDVFEFLAKCHDDATTGIYCDPPFPSEGGGYKHKFSIADHRRLAEKLTGYKAARVVCRFYDCDLVRDLYPAASGWKYRYLLGRDQTNTSGKPEVLLIKNAKTPIRVPTSPPRDAKT